jgi:two-component sensor histidine kinase
MPAVLARSTTVLEGDRKANLLAQPPPPAGGGYRPINGLLALCERPAGVIAVTTLAEALSRISGSPQVPFGQYLRDLCHDIGSNGLSLTCTAADAALPIGTAVTLRLVADLLIASSFVNTLPPGLAGSIAVSFTTEQEAWQLAVEDSGVAMPADHRRRDSGLTIARLLVLRLDGQLEASRVKEGTRCIVTIPRAAAQA